MEAKAMRTTTYTSYYFFRLNAAGERSNGTTSADKAFKWYTCGNAVLVVRHVDAYGIGQHNAGMRYARDYETVYKKHTAHELTADGVARMDDVNNKRDKTVNHEDGRKYLASLERHGADAERLEHAQAYLDFLEGCTFGCSEQSQVNTF